MIEQKRQQRSHPQQDLSEDFYLLNTESSITITNNEIDGL